MVHRACELIAQAQVSPEEALHRAWSSGTSCTWARARPPANPRPPVAGPPRSSLPLPLTGTGTGRGTGTCNTFENGHLFHFLCLFYFIHISPTFGIGSGRTLLILGLFIVSFLFGFSLLGSCLDCNPRQSHCKMAFKIAIVNISFLLAPSEKISGYVHT